MKSCNQRKAPVWEQDSDEETHEETSPNLDIVPEVDYVDLQWFVWNEVWHTINSNEAANHRDGLRRDRKFEEARKDARKSEEHLTNMQSRGLIPSSLLGQLRELTAESGVTAYNAIVGNCVLHVDPPEDYAALEAPPGSGCTAPLWRRLVRAVDVTAAVAVEDALGRKGGISKLDLEWPQLTKPEQHCVHHPPKLLPRSLPRNVPGILGKLQRRELNEVSEEPSYEVPPGECAPRATALCDPDGNPAAVGSVGLWLGSSDFVVACEEGVLRGLGSAFEVGVHGSLRDWPDVYAKDGRSPVLRGLLQEDGPCSAKRVSKVLCPDADQLAQVSGMALLPLQSFANARAVRSKLGYTIVKGWAIYDLMSMETGEGYMAERYWWNTVGEGGSLSWVDFTPRPEGMTELVLAEEPAGVTPKRRSQALTQNQLALGESLCCLRFPKTVVSRRVQLGTRGAIAVALQHALLQAEARTDGVVRRVMASACIRGAALEELTSGKPTNGDSDKLKRLTNDDNGDDDDEDDDDDDDPDDCFWDDLKNRNGDDENCELLLPVMQEVFGLLEGFSRLTTKVSAQEQELESFLEADGVEGLVRLTQEKSTWVAATAASALACACHRNLRARARALDAGATQALAELFAREDMQRMECYAAEAATALWQPENLAVLQQQMPPPQRGPDLGQEHWQELMERCRGALQCWHVSQSPRERRGHSWGRVLAFAQVVLGSAGLLQRSGTAAQPLVIWVLGAQDLVEGSLAEEGFFSSANCVEQEPTLVMLLGQGLRRLRGVASVPEKGAPAVVRTADYSEVPWLGQFGSPTPDFVAVLMGSSDLVLPTAIQAAIAHLPIVISTRCCPPADAIFRRVVKKQLLVMHTRCPFSTSGGSPDVTVDDNGWIFVVRGPDAIRMALNAEIAPEVVLPFMSSGRRALNKVPVIFWGILDIKYDTERPVLDRVKVLETGDGQTSQFSHHGADIKSRFEEGYNLDKSVDLDMQHVVSADKKLTHDVAEMAGFGHLVPKQACFLRQYDAELARRIQEELGLAEDDKVVLKLCNRTRAAGVVVTPVRELDEVLEDLLQPPKNLQWWFEEKICTMMDVEGSPVELGLGADHSFEEQRRHWWSNESPVFVAEVWCKSVPTEREGQFFDGTMRVGFVLRRRQSTAAESEQDVLPPVTPENLQMEWLGGYWKLPMGDIRPNSGSLRECIVSAAKASGTAHVNATHLMEVFAALDDITQRLYGSPEPSSHELAKSYKSRPELAAFLTARLGTAGMGKRPAFAQQMLEDADTMLVQLPDSPGKRHVQAFVHRAQGVREMGFASDGGLSPEEHFRSALTLLPTNANALHLLGLTVLPHSPQDAVQHLTRSLLLDPDFKGAYANLALAYIRLRSWERAFLVARAGHARHPTAQQLAYHCAVASCKLALEIVDQAVELTEEYAQVQEAVQKANNEMEELQQKLKQAKADVEEKKAVQSKAAVARDEAKENLLMAERAAHEKGVVAGTRLRCAQSIVSFDGPPNWSNLSSFDYHEVVTAAGPPIISDGYRMVPIEPAGYLDMNDLEHLDQQAITEERKLFNELRVARELANTRWQDAVGEEKNLRASLKKALEATICTTVSRRAVSEILGPHDLRRYEELRSISLEMFDQARSGTLALSRRRGGLLSPWLEADEAMYDAMKTREGPVVINLPGSLGWHCPQYRL